MKLILPCITLNGTSPAMLRDHYLEARRALMVALDKINEIEFHSRDYAQQEVSTWCEASNIEGERRLMIASFAEDYYQIAQHCDKAAKRG